MKDRSLIPTIGLEIHAELKTQTKMFCVSRNDSNEMRPNVNVCPICMGHPGTLPTTNRKAVHQVLRVGVALGGTLARAAQFSRKNYFYPDIPKGYQISQYEHPLVTGGTLNEVAITRVHLEEDTGTLQHPSPFEGGQGGCSLIDFNRAGVPLMELVTEPVIHSAKEAADFGRELQLLLRYLNASDANMEKGEMRVEANISVAVPGARGTKVEVKNLNSFRAVERAIAYETKRQSALIAQGIPIVQETRGWDDTRQETFSQRRKEESHDYRYFPEPDLPTLNLGKVPEYTEGALRETLPELPAARRARYRTLGLKKNDADLYTVDSALGHFFDAVCREAHGMEVAILAANYLSSDVLGLRTQEDTHTFGALTPLSFTALIRMTLTGELSSRGAKDILRELFLHGGDPRDCARTRGLLQESDTQALGATVARVLHTHPDAVADYAQGKRTALQFLIGACMRETKGAGNPEVLRTLLEQALS